MNLNKGYFIAFFLFGVFVASLSQVLLKRSSLKEHCSIVFEYLNFHVIAAYSVFFLITFFNTILYKKIPLSLGPILESTSYIYIGILGVVFFEEEMPLRKIIGMIVIVIGIVVFSS